MNRFQVGWRKAAVVLVGVVGGGVLSLSQTDALLGLYQQSASPKMRHSDKSSLEVGC